MASKIHYTKPSITEREVAYATDAAREGWGERCYDYITRFEAAFADHLGVRHAVATSSCTGALHMGFAALGIGPGDEVILGDINWIASAAPITYLGARPVLVDVLPDTWCLDPSKVEEAITPRTKAILAVHLYGNLCELVRRQCRSDRVSLRGRSCGFDGSLRDLLLPWHQNHHHRRGGDVGERRHGAL
jgi:perosamine synthetase